MTYNNIKNIILTVLFGFMALTSCMDDDFSLSGGEDYDIPEGIKEGYSINLMVTLDKMGGTRAASSYNPLEEIENYIDPEKFRVLFFDHNDKFLFESKSRWVKKLDPGSIHSEWLVSIPVFTYGNDVFDYEYEDDNGNIVEVKGDEWDWEKIREALTTNSFKIAILANRPEIDWYPSFTDTEDHLKAHWYDNKGPYWYPKDTGKKDVFDLHHCQYDPLYHGKSKTTQKGVTEVGYYDFLMGDWDKTKISNDDDYGKMRPTMGATCSWVDFRNKKTINEYTGVNILSDAENIKESNMVSCFIRPDSEHPIPMYGIREFEPIKNWTKGTPFNLSDLADGDISYDFRTISLLRSAVRLDLLIPETFGEPDFVSMYYPNVYSRCEPMNVWTDTNDIWEDDHGHDCEWINIMDYGLVDSKYIKKGGTNRYSNLKNDFQKTISWYHGEWLEKGWKFINSEGVDVSPANPETGEVPSYPKIFNPCIQRNLWVMCDKQQGDFSKEYSDGYYHYVVYTGERNMIDPNILPLMKDNAPDNSATHAYAMSWLFKVKGKDEYYCIPIADYSKDQSNAKECFGPYKTEDFKGKRQLPTTNGSISTYADDLKNLTEKEEDKEKMPWPLLRNHIYRIIVTGPSPTELTKSYTWDFRKSLNGTTVYNLTTDANWANPGKQETQILSHDQISSQAHNGDEGSAKITWWGGSNDPATLKRKSGNDFSSDGTITINGISRSFIKTGRGDNAVQGEVDDRTTTLTVPGTKKISKLTLYSYVKSSTSTSNSGVKQWAVSSAPTGGKASSISDNGEEVMRIRFGTPKSGDSWKRGDDGKTVVTYPSGGQSYTFNYYVATGDTNGSGGTLAADGSTEANYISITTKFDGKLIIYVHNMGASNGSNGSKNTVLYEDGVQKEATLIGTDSKGTKKFNGNDDIYVLNGNKNYTGGFLIEVKAGKTYTMSMKGSKTRWQGVIFDYVKQTESSQHYWADVTDNTDKCGPDNAPLKVLSAQNSLGKLDTYTFEFNDKRSVSFTSGGTEQICYVASVDIEDENGTDYWKLNSSSNGELKANGKIIPELQGLKFNTTGSIYIYETVPSKIRLTGTTTITFPSMPEGTTITIESEPVSGDVTDWITPNGSNLESNGTNSWKVKSEGTAAFAFNGRNEGVDIYKISVEVPANARFTRAVSNGNEGGLTVESEDLHSKSIKFGRR